MRWLSSISPSRADSKRSRAAAFASMRRFPLRPVERDGPRVYADLVQSKIQNRKSKIPRAYATARSYLQFSLGQWRVVAPVFLSNLSNRIGEPQLGQGSATGFSQDVNLHSG